MKSRSEEFEEWGTEVIFGRAKGFRAAMMRVVLRGASWLFRLVVLARLYLFHSSIARQARLQADLGHFSPIEEQVSIDTIALYHSHRDDKNKLVYEVLKQQPLSATS